MGNRIWRVTGPESGQRVGSGQFPSSEEAAQLSGDAGWVAFVVCGNVAGAFEFDTCRVRQDRGERIERSGKIALAPIAPKKQRFCAQAPDAIEVAGHLRNKLDVVMDSRDESSQRRPLAHAFVRTQ